MNRMTKIAAAATLAAVVALPASQAFAASKTENALIGAAVGALAGGLLSHGDTGGVVAGAAVGGLIGAVADKPDRYHRGYAPTYRSGSSYRSTAYRAPQPRYRSVNQYDYRSADQYGYRQNVYPTGYRSGYGY